MKNSVFILIAFSVAAILFAITTKDHTNTIQTDNSKGFAVMELFTSQGCSSCPRADELLGEYAEKNDDRIIPIAFHVDYWNYLGWKDSFATLQYTQRQENYNNRFLHTSVYTPQLIINGEKEMVGSDKEKIKNVVNTSLNEKPEATITIKKLTIANGWMEVEYSIDGSNSYAILNAVLVQHKTSTAIKAGENNGSTLINCNVARDFVSLDVTSSGTCKLHLPTGVNSKELSVILFTQDSDSGKITGAVKKGL